LSELRTRVEAALTAVDARDGAIQALVPEEGRRERLLREAERLESRFPDPEERPALFGVLVGVKDIFRVAGLPTRAGSTLPEALFEGPEAPCVTALREAGALILGKTHTTEFAYFEPGPTRNPRALDHTPGGSSSGSAAAVAAGYCDVALGSQTVGSVIRPAAFCGVVGFKPTYDRISREGVIPFSPSMDHVGLLASAAITMMPTASWVLREWEPAAVFRPQPVLGVPVGPYLEQASRAALAAYRRQIDLLQDHGYDVRDVPALPDIDAVNRRHRRIIAAEMAAVHALWYPAFAERYRPRTAAIIREGQAVIAEEAGELAESLANIAARADEVRRGRVPPDAEQARAKMEAVLRERFGGAMPALRDELQGRMAEARIDVWVCPAATGPAPKGLHSTGDPAMNLPWTHAGMPAVTVPAGTADNGLPFGLQLVAAAGGDEALLRFAAEIELLGW
jgi:Asp-tRNA(Asn)/Glu-tRNA(Gln) amidotransferase A subunit family amidase